MNEKKAKKQNDQDDADVDLQPDLDELGIESDDDVEPNDRRLDPLRRP